MKFSAMIASGLLLLVGAVMLAEATSYGYNPMAAYGAGGCSGYGCGAPAAAAAAPAKRSYGAYARPVVYGGRGMYSYKGYARHPAPEPKKHPRYVRSCSGYSCGRRMAGYPKAAAAAAAAPKPSYGHQKRAYGGAYGGAHGGAYGGAYMSAYPIQYSDAPRYYY